MWRTFATPGGVAIDALTGNDFIYVAPSAPAAIIALQLDHHDHIFGDDNVKLVENSDALQNKSAESLGNAHLNLHEEGLLQMLAAWQDDQDNTNVTYHRLRFLQPTQLIHELLHLDQLLQIVHGRGDWPTWFATAPLQALGLYGTAGPPPVTSTFTSLVFVTL